MQEGVRDNFDLASPTRSSILRKGDKTSFRNNLFEDCRNILKKTHQSRIPIQNQTLLRLLQKSELLKEIVEIQGMDFLKGVLRHAKIEIVDERQVVAEQDQSLNYVVVVLQGKLGVQRSGFMLNVDSEGNQNKQYVQNLSLKTEGLIQKLTVLAKKERDQVRKTSKLQKKTSFPVSQYDFMLPILTLSDYAKAKQNIERNILINQEYGGKQRLNGTSYPNRVIAVERSVLLVFQFNFLFYWLETAFKIKMSKNIERFKTIPAFDILEEEKIAQIIMAMKFVKRRKNDVIYRQGEDAQHIFLLIQGELKITKEIDLFKQNPNDFYVDRRQLVKHPSQEINRSRIRSFNKDSKKDKDNILHFANLTTLYNYRPMKKSLELGLISSLGLFGEEQVVYGTKRQATIQVNSIEVSFYTIEFKKIIEIIGKMQDKFKQILEGSLSKKILYRQHGFASQVDFQNRTNLNYFYLEEGKDEYESPRKYKLEKINEKVMPNTARDTTDHAPPYYTTFNFNKMIKKKSQSNRKQSEQKTNESIEPFSQPRYNQTQEKLMGISHSWNPIERKVKQQKLVSRKISPFKHQINISQPLIDQQFFKDVAKEQRRINKEFRTIRLSLGKKLK